MTSPLFFVREQFFFLLCSTYSSSDVPRWYLNPVLKIHGPLDRQSRLLLPGVVQYLLLLDVVRPEKIAQVEKRTVLGKIFGSYLTELLWRDCREWINSSTPLASLGLPSTFALSLFL